LGRRHGYPLYTEEQKRARERRKRERLRAAALWRLGNVCETCGFTDTDCLTCDHRDPLHRRTNGLPEGTGDTYNEVLRMGDPRTKFALLCANCHVKKTRVSGEFAANPHLEPLRLVPDDGQLELPLGALEDPL
jgi:hypothetical protein